MKRSRLQRLLNKLDGTNEKTAGAIRDFETGVKTLREKLREDIQVSTLDEVNLKINRFKNSLNLQGLENSLRDLETNFKESVLSLVNDLEDKTGELEKITKGGDESLSSLLEERAETLGEEISAIKSALDRAIELNKTELKEVAGNINTIVEKINKMATRGELDKTAEEVGQTIKELKEASEKEIGLLKVNSDDFRKEFMSRLSDVRGGGGNMNRQIRVEGSVLGKYADINFYGVGSSVVSSIDNTNRLINIGVTGGAGAGFVPYTGATANVALGTFGITSGDILPTTDNAYDIGSDTFRWKNFKMYAGSLDTITTYAANTRGIVIDASAGTDDTLYINNSNVSIRRAIVPTAYLHIAAGTTDASTAPIKLTTGTSMTVAEAGAFEFTTDDLFFTITTGAARKNIALWDTLGTSGRIPFATTNGRLTDDADFTFATDTLTVTKIAATTFTGLVTTTLGTFTSTVADGATAVGFALNTSTTYATAGAKLLTLKNNTTEYLTVTYQGKVGIGATAPAQMLHIDSLTVNQAFIRLDSSSADEVYFGNYLGHAFFQCPNTKQIQFYTDAGATQALTLADGGYMGTKGVTAPTAWLHLTAGVAAANGAPLKFTSGTNNTTAEAGAMEYNGTNLFFTRSGTVREGVLTQSAVTTEVVVSDTTVTINIGGTTYKLLAKA